MASAPSSSSSSSSSPRRVSAAVSASAAGAFVRTLALLADVIGASGIDVGGANVLGAADVIGGAIGVAAADIGGADVLSAADVNVVGGALLVGTDVGSAADVEAGPSSSRFAKPCWESARAESLCCAGATFNDETAAASGGCFDHIFTQAECCDGNFDGVGWALESVDAEPEPLPAPGAGPRLRKDGLGFVLDGHPSFGARQRRFEEIHRRALTILAPAFSQLDGSQDIFLRMFKLSTHRRDDLVEHCHRPVSFLLRSGITPDAHGVVVDVGAGIGMLAICLAAHFPHLLIIAVEAAPENFRFLAWNVRKNGVADRIFPVNAAVRGPRQSEELKVQWDYQRPWHSILCDIGATCGSVAPSVVALTLAQLLVRFRLRRVRWLKLRCSGCEWAAFDDPVLAPLLRDTVGLMTVGLSHPSSDTSAESQAQVLRVVEAWCQRPEDKEVALGSFVLSKGKLGSSVDATGAPSRSMVDCTLAPCGLAAPSEQRGVGPREEGEAGVDAGACAGHPALSLLRLQRGAALPREGRRQWLASEECDVGFVEHAIADGHCRHQGLRLCSTHELGECLADDRWKCGLDDQFVWSGAPCEDGRGFLAVRVGAQCSLGGASALECRRFAFGGRCCKDPLAAEPAVAASRRIVLLSSLSHDDEAQWPLLPHFLMHYRDFLGLQPKHFLLILHSESGNVTGLERMAHWLGEDYGVVNVFIDLLPYTSERHSEIKYDILRRHVTDEDWVVQVDADELVVFPEYKLAPDALEKLDMSGEHVHFCLMIDRLPPDGDIDVLVREDSSIFDQYPLNCALTTLAQNSDSRKVCAYRGFLRVTAGNHNVAAWSLHNATHTIGPKKKFDRMREEFRGHVGEAMFQLFPDSYKVRPRLPAFLASALFGSAFHFKWIRGVRTKLLRRLAIEEYTRGQYSYVLGLLVVNEGKLNTTTYCIPKQLLSSSEPRAALSSRDLVMLFMNLKFEDSEQARVRMDFPSDEFYHTLATRIHTTMAHEDFIWRQPGW